MQIGNNSHNIIKYHQRFSLRHFFDFRYIVLQIDKIVELFAEMMRADTVDH